MANASAHQVKPRLCTDQDVLLLLCPVDVPRSSIPQTSTAFHAQMATFQIEPRKFAKEPNLNVDQSKSLDQHQVAIHALHAHQTRSQPQIEDHAQ